MSSVQKKRSFVMGAAVLAFAGVICKVIGVLFRVWANNIIGLEGMVYYEVVFPFYSWLLILASSGIPTAISKMVSERAALGNWMGARRVFRKSLLMLAILGLITSAVMFFGAEFFATTFAELNASEGIIFKALAPALFFVSVLCAYRGYLQGLQLMSGTGISQIAEQVFKCIVGLSLAYYIMQATHNPVYGACGALVGITVSELVAVLIMMIFKRVHRRDCLPPDACTEPSNESKIISKMLKVAVPITLGASILPITSIIDVKMIFSLTAADNIKQCYVALSTYVRSIINLPASLTVALAMSLVPAISAAMAKQDEAGMKRAARMGIKLSMAIGMPCAIGLLVLGTPIVKLLFSNVTADTLLIVDRLFKVASFTVIFISLVQTATGALQGIGKQRIPVYCLLIGAVCKVVTNLILLRIDSVNIVGASWSNIACYGVAGILDVIFLARYTKMSLNVWKVFLKPALASLIMGASVYFGYGLLNRLIGGSVATVIAVLVGIIIYALLVVVLRLFDKDELGYLPLGRFRRRVS